MSDTSFPTAGLSAQLAQTAAPSRTNWAGNYHFQALEVVQPATVEEVQALVTRSPRVKALGTRHSFNHIADTAGTQISLAGLKSMTLDAGNAVVTVGGGVTYGELAPWLDRQGFAVHNLASLPHISVAGACATATHGSGLANGCLSTAVRGLELVTADGEVKTLSAERMPEIFAGAVVGLGAPGVATAVTLAVQPRFEVAQTVYENLSFDRLQDSLRDVFSGGYSVSLFTDWQGHRATQAWVKRRVPGGPSARATEGAISPFPVAFFGATRQTAKLHPLPGLDPTNCTEQLGVPGPWYERLPHFRTDYTPSSGAELQTEYFVPIEQAYEALLAVEALRDRITPLLLISELRTVAADSLWLSMAEGRTSVAIHFTWKQELEAVRALLPLLEEVLAPFGARPHWAKLFTTPAKRMEALYPRFPDFRALMDAFDPGGRFRNGYLGEIFA